MENSEHYSIGENYKYDDGKKLLTLNYYVPEI